MSETPAAVVEETAAAPSNPAETPAPQSPEVETPSDATAPKEQAPAEVSTGTPEWTPVEADVSLDGLQYGGLDVVVDIPADLVNLAGEKGVDIQAVSKELYSSPDFTLSQETLEGLYSTFGKWQVDAYLSSVKMSNDAMANDFKKGQETRAANEQAAWEATMDIMGGEDRWDDMSAYAVANLSPEEVEEFNSVMESGSLRMQQLMIKDLYSRFKEAGAPVAPEVLDLEEGGTVPAGETQTALSSQEYLKLIASGEYKKDPAKYDALRRAGMRKGI